MNSSFKFTTDVKKQHTVPRFLLHNFGFGKQGKRRRVYTFDKKNDRKFQQSVFDATTRNMFYDIKSHPEKASLEPALGMCETQTAPLVNRIIQTNSIGWLTNEEKVKIATFIAIQRSRSYVELQKVKHAADALMEKVASIRSGQATGELAPEEYIDAKKLFLKMILDQKESVKHLMNKSWILYQTDSKDPFFISDNPVTLHNDIDMGPYGNIGLAVKGIQIHLPLSSSLTLGLTCPSISQLAIEGKREVERLLAVNSPHLSKLKNPQGVIEFGNAYESGDALIQTSDNVRFLNGLQVSSSEQYIFCESDHFALVEEMIGDNDRYRSGPRLQID